MASVFSIRDLTFGYTATPVLNAISLEVAAGEFVALVGPNGAGKSTLLKILAGLIPIHTGRAEFASKAISQWKTRDLARRIAFVPQETHVAFPFTAGEIVMMGRMPHRGPALFDTEEDFAWTRRSMDLTDTAALTSKPFTQLSGGERQRVVLASALAQDPEVLLLDEPTAFLDLKHQIQFYEILERLNSEKKMTIISVTHDVNLAARYARRMIGMRAGKLVVDGAPDDVLTPANLHGIFEITAAVFKRPDGRGSYIVPTG